MEANQQYERFFHSVPDARKLRLPDGKVVFDAAIIPRYAQEHGLTAIVEAAEAEVKTMPTHDHTVALLFDSGHPKWVAGESKELNYRGNPVKRDKMWFQRDMEHLYWYAHAHTCKRM